MKYSEKFRWATLTLLLMLCFTLGAKAEDVKIYYQPGAPVGDQAVQLYAVEKTLGGDAEYTCVMNQVGTYYGSPVYCAELGDASVDLIAFRLCSVTTTGEGEELQTTLTPVTTVTGWQRSVGQLRQNLSAYDGKKYDGSAWTDVALDVPYTVYYAGNVTAATVGNATTSDAMSVTATDRTYHGLTISTLQASLPYQPTYITFDGGEHREYADGKLYTTDERLEYAYDGGPYTLTGDFNQWASPGQEFAPGDEDNIVTTMIYLAQGSSTTCRVAYDGYLYGAQATLTRQDPSVTISRDGAQGTLSITADQGGMYVLTLDPNTLQLTVTCPTYATPENPQHKPVWQQTDAQGEHYMKHRKALVGNGCEVNKLSVVVGVGSWASGLGNLTDEDLTNKVTLTKVVGASIGTNPIAGVRDMNNHYAAGTRAGFHVLTSSDSKVLSLDVIKAFALSFYCEGKLVGTVPIAPEVQVLQLDLLSFSANGEATIDIEATAPAEFDEILLQPGGGINADVVNAMQIQYAYVGDAYKYTLTSYTDPGQGHMGGIGEYDTDYGRSLQLRGTNAGVTNTALTDANLTNGTSANTLTLGNLICAVTATPKGDDPEGDVAPFRAGYNVGMHFTSGSVLNLGLGGTKTMQLLGKNGEVLQTEHLNTTVLGLGLATGGAGDNVITAQQDFYGVKFTMAGVSVNLGAFVTHYFYVTPPPTVDHHCPIRATANTAICDYTTTYQLSHNADVPVTWTLTAQPDGASAMVDETGLVSGMTVEGEYHITATAEDGCEQQVVLTRGSLQAPATVQDNVLYNVGEGHFALSDDTHGVSGSLISISNLSDPENILNAQYEDYAQYTAGLALADNLMVCGVKTQDGTPIGATRRVGFVVETTSSGLDLNALNLFHIVGFRAGTRVFDKPVEESNAIALNLIGSSKVQKMRFSVALDGTETFDEIQLWKSGVLGLSISRLNIYYAFANDEAKELALQGDNGMGCGLQVISNVSTGASINSDANSNVQVLGVANVSDNVTYLIDDDPQMETYLQVANTVNAGGGTYAIRLGRTFGSHYQVGIVMDAETYAANVKLGTWLTLQTYLNGTATGDSKSDWKVLGVDAIGAGDKRMMMMTTTTEFDEVRFTLANVVGALQYPKFYGIVVRSDVDGDGIPDCQDTQSCYEELVLDEDAGRGDRNADTQYNAKGRDYSRARLVLHRNITRGATHEEHVWCSLVLPVSLTGLQVRNAFGNDTRIAMVHSLDENNPHLLNFQSVPLGTENDNDIVIQAGRYYIIQTLREPQVSKTERYLCQDGNNLYGEVYFVNDVDYDHAHDEGPQQLTLELPAGQRWTAENGYYPVQFTSSYNCAVYPVGCYVFSGGNLYKQYGAHNINAFRFWLQEDVPADEALTHELTFQVTDDEGTITSLIPVHGGSTFVEAGSGVYNLAGQKVAAHTDADRLSPGVYVVKGKKMIVK